MPGRSRVRFDLFYSRVAVADLAGKKGGAPAKAEAKGPAPEAPSSK